MSSAAKADDLYYVRVMAHHNWIISQSWCRTFEGAKRKGTQLLRTLYPKSHKAEIWLGGVIPVCYRTHLTPKWMKDKHGQTHWLQKPGYAPVAYDF